MAKVALARCENYDREKVFLAVKRAVGLVGGIGDFVKAGMNVLLKPNLLSARPPEDAVDTHPEVVRAVARLVKEAGARPLIGDSPGGYGKNIDEVFAKSGMKAMAQEEGVDLVKFTTPNFIDGIPIARHALDSGCIISIPKLKTHCITLITAAVKNMYGVVTGVYKAECHSRAPKEEDFAKIVAKVYSLVRPHLTVLDGIMAMEGDGPGSGEPRMMNLVMAGRDAVAIDACVAVLVGIKPDDVRVTKEAHETGLGECDMSRIELVGDDMGSFMARDFKLPQTMPLKLIPRPLANNLAAMVRFKPYIDNSVCTRCNLCKISCPVSAITIERDRCSIDYKRCVRCLCCHEVCPYRAIGIRRNILTRIVWG
jgi:uncharacterized protein (DUF362 family)/Pyruvate/2-oxoacid:ferredoxin oxidoreductase delta subunit